MKRKTRRLLVWPSENKKSRESDGKKKKEEEEEHERINIGPRMSLCVLLVEPYPQLLGYTAFKRKLN